jgi:hypothetical protein
LHLDGIKSTAASTGKERRSANPRRKAKTGGSKWKV